MKTIQINTKYIEWISAEEMHEASKKWLSELLFIADEHLFFQDLVKTYTLQLLNSEEFSDTVEIIDVLNRSQKLNNELIELVRDHEKGLEIMVDGVNEPKEESVYKIEHKQLVKTMSEFYKEFTDLKTQLFQITKSAIKKDKEERLLDKK
jgi:hypothetical protein